VLRGRRRPAATRRPGDTWRTRRWCRRCTRQAARRRRAIQARKWPCARS